VNRIHPTAIVEPGARLGDKVEIGPYAIVGGQVEIGSGTIVQSHVVIEGAVRLGQDNRIGPGAIIGGWPQDLNFKPETQSAVEIGNRNVVREHVTIHRGTGPGSATRIGDDNFLMADAHLGHNCTVGNKVIVANNCLLGGYVSVGDGAFLGGACIFHQHLRVGRLAITQGGSKHGQDIPPFCLAASRSKIAGLNVVGLRRAGMTAEQRAEIKSAFRLLYESGLNVRQALDRAKEMKWSALGEEFFHFVATARGRGICGALRVRSRREE
jgi:UDP-N-acetylglucosamine acyltransferase